MHCSAAERHNALYLSSFRGYWKRNFFRLETLFRGLEVSSADTTLILAYLTELNWSEIVSTCQVSV